MEKRWSITYSTNEGLDHNPNITLTGEKDGKFIQFCKNWNDNTPNWLLVVDGAWKKYETGDLSSECCPWLDDFGK